jgi:hypothetical protein
VLVVKFVNTLVDPSRTGSDNGTWGDYDVEVLVTEGGRMKQIAVGRVENHIRKPYGPPDLGWLNLLDRFVESKREEMKNQS